MKTTDSGQLEKMPLLLSAEEDRSLKMFAGGNYNSLTKARFKEMIQQLNQ